MKSGIPVSIAGGSASDVYHSHEVSIEVWERFSTMSWGFKHTQLQISWRRNQRDTCAYKSVLKFKIYFHNYYLIYSPNSDKRYSFYL